MIYYKGKMIVFHFDTSFLYVLIDGSERREVAAG